MIFFNLELIEKGSKNNTDVFLDLFKIHCTGRLIPKHFKIKTLYGYSWILNPNPLLAPPSYFNKEYLVQYIKLAARRDYALYKQYGVKSLILSYYPDLNIEAISSNPLLKIKSGHLLFKFEEIGKTKNGN